MSAPFRGEPLIFHAIRAARAAPVDRVLVVCAPHLDIGEWGGGPEVGAVRLASPELAASLKAGIAAASDAEGAFIFLGDMPLVPHDVTTRLAKLLTDHFAAIPQFEGRKGHPVLLSARAFPSVAKLAGDEGAGRLLKHRDDIAFLDCASEGVLLDIDRAEDLARLEKYQGD